MSSHVDEYVVRVPKQTSKKYNVMKFNAADRVDVRNWVEGSLTRNLSAKKIYVEEETYPEFGEGSEYGRKQREQARKLKYGRRKTVFQESDQPWDLKISTIENQLDSKKKVNGKVPTDLKPNIVTKNFTGRKEGGIGEGSMYFVFFQLPDYAFEAYPAADWYNFKRKIAHRTLTDEEAEAAWDKRDKILNHLNYMARKRLHIKDEEGDEEGETSNVKKEVKKGGKKKQTEESDLVIHDDEDLDLYMSDSSSDEEEATTSSKKKKKKQKKEKSDDEVEALEDSDDGEHEGDEIAYASDVSSENEEILDSRVVPKGLDEEESSSSSEEEEEKKDDAKDADAINKLMKDSEESASSSESGSDIEEEESISKSALFMNIKKMKDKKGKGSKSGSRSSTPTSELSGSSPLKSKLEKNKKLDKTGRQSPLVGSSGVLGKRGASSSNDVSNKRPKIAASSLSQTSQSGISEEAVKKYLLHKPITSKDLLKKFKKTGLSSEEIVNRVASILKRLNPDKKTISGKLHLFLKSS